MLSVIFIMVDVIITLLLTVIMLEAVQVCYFNCITYFNFIIHFCESLCHSPSELSELVLVLTHVIKMKQIAYVTWSSYFVNKQQTKEGNLCTLLHLRPSGQYPTHKNINQVLIFYHFLYFLGGKF